MKHLRLKKFLTWKKGTHNSSSFRWNVEWENLSFLEINLFFYFYSYFSRQGMDHIWWQGMLKMQNQKLKFVWFTTSTVSNDVKSNNDRYGSLHEWGRLPHYIHFNHYAFHRRSESGFKCKSFDIIVKSSRTIGARFHVKIEFIFWWKPPKCK